MSTDPDVAPPIGYPIRTYIGTKIIQAVPMDELTFQKEIKGNPNITEGQKNQSGYKVIYPDGYISWSPCPAFEATHRIMSNSEKKLII